MCLKGIATD